MHSTTYTVRTTYGQSNVVHSAGGWNDRAADTKRAVASDSARQASGYCGKYAKGSKSRKSGGTSATMPGKSFDEIKAQCLREKKLFEDPDFPAVDSSIFYSRSPPRPFVWKRPTVSYLHMSFSLT